MSLPLEIATTLATNLLTDMMRFRRTSGPKTACETSPCLACLAPHLQQVTSAILHGRPIPFVLPAFPGKSPNLAKVLGPLPDMAERRSLEFLHQLCLRIQESYSPGAQVILCSDGRVFGDVVGMRDGDVTEYQKELSLVIKEMSLTTITTFNLDAIYGDIEFDRMRFKLMEQYGEPLDEVRNSIREGAKPNCTSEDEQANRLYCGITRFLVEDAMRPGQTYSRSALQKICRQRAYEVIQRSRAWSNLIEDHFADAVRLSIHPQACGSKKFGIRLMEPDNWMTPWHGVAVDVGGRFILLKRSEAEARGARMITRDGRPSHFELEPRFLNPAQPFRVLYEAQNS